MLRRALPLAFVALAACSVTAAADPLTVTTTADGAGSCAPGACTLRAAINAANATADEDTVVVPAGTYLLTLGTAGEDAGASGDLDLGLVSKDPKDKRA